MTATLTEPEASGPKRARSVIRAITVCFIFSGATALIYEVLWARMLGLVFGATTIAISAVLTAFMGGLALGSAVAAKVVDRLKQPLQTYGFVEIAIGVYALIVPLLFRGLDQVYAAIWIRLHPGFYGFALSRFALAAAVLIVPTALMGATLPVLVAAVRSAGRKSAHSIARLYTANLAGAILGTLAAGFLLLPALGVAKTIWVAAVTNLAIGVAAVFANKKAMLVRAGQPADNEITNSFGESRHANKTFWLFCALASGLITISMQIVWSRMLSMIIGSSTYAFTIVLALFLVGLAMGAWIVSAKAKSANASLRRWIFWFQLATAASLFLSLRIANAIPSLLINAGLRLRIDSWPALLAMQVVAAAVLILLPVVLMGMTMPLVLTWTGGSHGGAVTADSAAARLSGQAYAINTVGSIAGAIVTAFVLVPMTSTRFTIFCMATIAIVVAAIAYEPRKTNTDRALARSIAAGASAVLIIAMLFVWPRLNLNALSAGAYDSFVRVLAKSRGGVPADEQRNGPADHQLLMYVEGRTATVSVRRDWGITSVAINGRTNASDTEDMPTQVMLGELPMLTAPRTERVLMVGFASGVTAGSVLQSRASSVECVELEPAAVASSRFFEHVNNRPLDDPRLRVIIDDARTYLRVTPTTYDVIISEPSHPWVPGVANLFTREFFALGRDRLREDGIFAQWFQTYQLSTGSLRAVLATFHEAFPHVVIFRIQGAAKGKDLLLLGSRAPIRLDRIEERMKDPKVAADLPRVGLNSADDLRAWFVCDETRLGPAVRGAIINTDDNMYVETVAPREAFRPTVEENAAWVEKLRGAPSP